MNVRALRLLEDPIEDAPVLNGVRDRETARQRRQMQKPWDENNKNKNMCFKMVV